MARQLPNIKNNSIKSETALLVPRKRFSRTSSVDMNPQKTRLNKMVESRLAKQFQYFRGEFLEHALSIGIPVPLDMVEDKNGKVVTFVNQKGPRYLLNIIHAYPESVHLLRSSLSFLIIIISILNRRITCAIEMGRDDANNSIYSWAVDALNSIADSSSVAICTNLLRHSHSEAIQELILNLLAQLVGISAEAAAQMLHRPQVSAAANNSSEPQGSHEGRNNPSTPRGDGKAGGSDPDEMTCLSFMFSVVSHNRNRYTVMTSCAEVCLALLKDNSEEVSETMARTRICDMPVVKPDESAKKERYSNKEEKEEKKKIKPKGPASKYKSLAVLTRKPPTTALARRNRAAKITPRSDCSSRNPDSANDNHPNEWAALKVLLKFLHRFMRYGSSQMGQERDFFLEISHDGIGDDSHHHPIDNDDIVPQKLKKALYTAHSRVLLVVAQLVINSTAVAKYILSMPGACAILKASCDIHKESVIGEKVKACLLKLQGESESLFKKELKQHHSLSFELTHGKSAKLFNPVSPISRRESAMLFPERCGASEFDSFGNIRPSSRSNEGISGSQTRPRSQGASFMFAVTAEGGLGDGFSRPPSRASQIPSSQLFTAEEERYEEKRIFLEQERMKEKDFFDENEDESQDLEEDSWFLGSYEVDDTQKKMKRRKRPPAVRTSFDDSRPVSTSNRPISSQRPRSPVPPYNPVESPKRRGLGPHNGGIKSLKDPNESLHRSLFTNLPNIPDMPVRLEAEDIINDSNMQHKNDLLERSMTVTSSVLEEAYRDGFYNDGKSNIPISERARRVYVPDMTPFPGEDRHPHFVTPEYLEELKNRPKTPSSVLGERSAKLREQIKRSHAARMKEKQNSLPCSPQSRIGSDSYFNDAFSDYYNGLLPMSGVGELEPDSGFQMFLIEKQHVNKTRANTAPPSSTRRDQEILDKDDSESFLFEKNSQTASYASSQSPSLAAVELQCNETSQEEKRESHGQLSLSMDMIFPS